MAVLILLLGLIFYALIYYLLVRGTDYDFAFTGYMNEYDRSNIGQKPPSILQRQFQTLLKIAQKMIRLDEGRREKLRLDLERARMKETPEAFMAQKMIYALLMAILFSTLYIINQNKLFIGIGVIASIMLFLFPNYVLAKHKRYAESMIRVELPDYFTPLAKMMGSFTPYQAVKECEKFAGPYLKPYVNQLMVDMDLMPGSFKPFQKFATQVDVSQAHLFVVAIQQAMSTDQKRSRDILEKQRIVMMKMREEGYNELINKKPLAINKFNVLILLNMALIILTMMISVFFDLFNTLG